jgi:hypothetical protein
MALYIFSLLGMVVYTFTLSTKEIGIVYVTGAVLGLVQVFTLVKFVMCWAVMDEVNIGIYLTE